MRISSVAQLASIAALASATPEPEPYRPFFPPTDLQAAPVERDTLLSRALLQEQGNANFFDHGVNYGGGLHQRHVLTRSTHNGHKRSSSMEKRGAGEGKRGLVRRVVRRAAVCSTSAGILTSTSSPSVAMPATSASQTTMVSISTTSASQTTDAQVTTSSTSTSVSTVAPSASVTNTNLVISMDPTSTTSIGGEAIASTTSDSVSPTSVSTSPTSVSVSSSTSISSSTTSQTPTTSSTPPAPTSLYTVDPAGNGPFSGWGTWFEVGLGACGWWNQASDPIVAVSAQLFDNWPGYNGWNPNDNPICGLHLNITWGGKWAIAEVADRCPGCDVRSLDFSEGLFEHFASLDVGLLGMELYTGNMSWSWVEGTGSLPSIGYTPQK